MSAKTATNSKWHKSKPRPSLWSKGIVKEEKPTRRAENPAARNARYTVVYNVKVKESSIGMTFDIMEAKSWAKATVGAVIVHVPYVVPN